MRWVAAEFVVRFIEIQHPEMKACGRFPAERWRYVNPIGR
jgi:hypothetical protein